MIKIEVNEGKAPWIAGIATILFGILYGVLCTIYPSQSLKSGILHYLMAYPVAVLITLAGTWLCMTAENRKLVVEDAVLCYTNSFGIKYPFLLNDIAYCRTALENGGNRDFLKLYNAKDEKLCKLEFNMHNSVVFFQYLIDNQVKIECSEKSDYFLKYLLNMESIYPEAIPDAVNNANKEVKELIKKWIEKNKKFGVEWKTGIVDYLESEVDTKKQLWEQTSCGIADNLSGKLPEGYAIVLEGYLLKNGEFVIDKRGKAVCFVITIISVVKSLKIGEELKIGNSKSVSEELSTQLSMLEATLPRNRYHTETLVLNHELRDSL